jgi:predicted RNA binding protein YcfA (HicA-like mRNA interferase family)
MPVVDRKTVAAHVLFLKGRRTGVRYGDLKRMLEDAGCQQVSSGGSHRTFKHPAIRPILTLKDPGSGDVLPVYIRMTRQLLEQVLGIL